MLHRRSDAEQAAADAESAVREQQARLNTLSAQLRTEPENVGLYQEHDPDTRVQTLLASLQDLRGRRAAARGRYLDSSKTVRDIEGQIASRESELARLARDPTASVVRTGRNPAIDQLRLDRDRAAAEYAAATARRDAATGEVQHIAAALTALDVNETELEILQRHVALETDALATQSHILAERRLTEAEDALRFAKVRVIQPARVPQTPRPLPLLIVAAGVVMGMVASAMRVAARFMLSPSVLTAEGLTAATGLDVLAVFPRILAEPQVA
jgi:chromosome segregation ATPase